jgi:AraC-like DNA-binding protein
MIQQFQELIEPDVTLRRHLRGADLAVTDATDIHRHMSRVIAPHAFDLTGIRSRSVDFWHHAIDLDGISLHYVDYQCDAEMANVVIDQPGAGITVKFPLAETTLINTGRTRYCLRPNQFTVLPPGQPYRAMMRGECRHLTLAINGDWLGRYLNSRYLPVQAHNLSFALRAYDVGTDGMLLSGILATLIGGLMRNDRTLHSPGVATHMKELITSAVLGLSPEYQRAGRCEAGAEHVPGYILRAEAYMSDNLDETILLEDIIRHSGTTRRTLHAGFRRHRGTTPMALLKVMRLKAAKAALEQAAEDAPHVTRVAMTYGFHHLGRFSNEFKAAFGILPSQVRRKPPTH